VKFYDGFDFGQKAEPSRWITFLVNRIENRIERMTASSGSCGAP
jgi:hypothetical protein